MLLQERPKFDDVILDVTNRQKAEDALNKRVISYDSIMSAIEADEDGNFDTQPTPMSGIDYKRGKIIEVEGQGELELSNWAFSQYMSRMGISGTYARKCLAASAHAESQGYEEIDIGNLKSQIDTWKSYLIAEDKDKDWIVRAKAQLERTDGVIGLARGIVSPAFTIMDDIEVMPEISGNLQEIGARFVHSDISPTSSHYKLVLGDVIEIPRSQGKPDYCWLGVEIANSAVGRRRYSLNLHLLTLACLNGMIVVSGDWSYMSMKHVNMDSSEAVDKIAEALAKIVERKDEVRGLFQEAAQVQLDRPQEALSSFLTRITGATSPIIDGISGLLLDDDGKERSMSAWEVSRAMTSYARNLTDPELRFNLETWGGAFLHRATR